jgi:hypothetical protein
VSERDGADAGAAAGRPFLACCAGLIGYALAYALPIYARLPKAYYDPIGRRWFWAAASTPIPMGYVGQLLWAAAGALVAAGATLAVARAGRTPSARAFTLGATWALTAIAIVVGYFTWNNWP